jgi:tetratricopeptide (TPR) repeat protein
MHRAKTIIWLALTCTMSTTFDSRADSRDSGLISAQGSLIQVNKELSDGLMQQGFAQLRNGLSRDALSTFQQAKAIDPLNNIIRFGLARSLQDEDQKVRALEEYTISIFLDPTYAKAYANRALVKGALQDLAGALDDLEAAIRIDKNMAPAYLNRGATLAALNKPKYAISDFDRAIEIDPGYADAYRNRGITKNFLGDLRGACSDWKKAGSLGQADPWLWYRQLCLKPAVELRSNGLRHPGQR